MKQTRRELVKSLASAFAGGGAIDHAAGTPTTTSDSTITPQKQLESYTNTTSIENMNGSTYLALPGVSMTSLIANLPQLLHASPSPIIYIDSYDYTRHRGRVLTERGNTKVQSIGMVYEELHRRGILRSIDYGDYYPSWIQGRNATLSTAVLEEASDTAVDNAATKAGDGYLAYCLGSYQESLRTQLGDHGAFTDRRKQVTHQLDKIKRGGGDPETWHQRIFSQYLTALAVRHYANRTLNVPIDGILGQGETAGIQMLLRSSGFDEELGPHETPIEHIGRINTDQSAAINESLDTVGTLATEITGTQHQDWFTIGPRLALPQFSDIFPQAWHSMRSTDDLSRIVSEATHILSLLEKEDHDNRSVAAIEAEAEWLTEEQEFMLGDKERLVDQLDTAVSLANHSRELREFADTEQFSRAAVYLAASIKLDPQYRYSEDEVFHRAMNMKRRLEPVGVSDSEIEYFRDRGQFRRGNSGKDWYQDSIFQR